MVFGYGGSDEDILKRYQADFGCKIVCLTTREILGVLRGAWSGIGLADGHIYRGRRYEFDVVDRFGTGDAFFAGFLYGYLEQGVDYALNFGNAACALAHTIEGDVARMAAHEVTAILNEGYDLRVRR
jgi:2-dehydro-3-deoxygluconokinase